jgi:23S rRNA pseudouridine2605 synthase
MHLVKYISQSGIASRRKANMLIKDGQITINHFPITDPTYIVKDKDTVRYQKKVLRLQELSYIVLNKPAGCVSTANDPEGRPTIFNHIIGLQQKNLHSIGRLDFNTTGVLIMTNDGTLTDQLAHPRHNIRKTYRVTLDRVLESKDLQKIREGVHLSDGIIKIDDVKLGNIKAEANAIVTIHSGKKHIIKRIFGHLGYHVRELDRVSFAGISYKRVARGSWRNLTKSEIEKLTEEQR